VFSNDNLSILEIFEQAMKDIKNGASISQAARKHNISRKALSRKVISVMI
jgi:DNA-binding transcriptional LysR family regulator